MKTNALFYQCLVICLGLSLTMPIQAGAVKKDAKELKDTKKKNTGDEEEIDDIPTGKGWGKPKFGAPRRTNSKVPQNGINYHGGPVLGISSTPNVYFIWYGNWSGSNAPVVLQNLVSLIGGTPRYNIETTYTNSSATPIKNAVTYVKSTTDNYSQGASANGTAILSDQGVLNVVSKAISSNALPLDDNAVYFVLSSADVNESSGFCTNYCGWHSYKTISSKIIKYAFVGNPKRCPSSCASQTKSSPNGDIGTDGMASILIHELEEAVTDPQINAWYDSKGRENADKCAWTFGATSTAANGSLYNISLGGYDYLLQQNWVNVKPGYCAKTY